MRAIIIFTFLFTHYFSQAQNLTTLKFVDNTDYVPLENLKVTINDQKFTSNKHGYIITKIKGDLKIMLNQNFYYLDTLIKPLVSQDFYVIKVPYRHIIDTVTIQEYMPVQHTRSKTILSNEFINNTMTLLGAKDPIKSIQMLPGVISGQEGSAYYYVRGGRAGENQILVDQVSLNLNPHLFGFLSNINPEIISTVDFYKGGFPARYGNALASITEIHTLNPAQKTTNTSYTLGMITSQFTHNRRIFKDKFGFVASIRSSPLPLAKQLYDYTKNTRIDNNNDTQQSMDWQNLVFGDVYAKLLIWPICSA